MFCVQSLHVTQANPLGRQQSTTARYSPLNPLTDCNKLLRQHPQAIPTPSLHSCITFGAHETALSSAPGTCPTKHPVSVALCGTHDVLNGHAMHLSIACHMPLLPPFCSHAFITVCACYATCHWPVLPQLCARCLMVSSARPVSMQVIKIWESLTPQLRTVSVTARREAIATGQQC